MLEHDRDITDAGKDECELDFSRIGAVLAEGVLRLAP